MNAKKRLNTSVCEILGIEYPVLLAGMGQLAGGDKRQIGSATPELVAAVSDAGGFGVLGASGIFPDVLREQLRTVKRLTHKPFGVDLLLPQQKAELPPGLSVEEVVAARTPQEHRDLVARMAQALDIPKPTGRSSLANLAENINETICREQVAVSIEEGATVIASALGMPEWLPPMCHSAGVKVVGLAGNVRAATHHKALGVDIIVAQGHEAGGHTGKIGTFALVPQVVDAVSPTPVLAAGGIGDGRGVIAALALGAVGVWMGTYFLFARESGSPPTVVDRMIKATEEDAIVSRLFTGKPARFLRSAIHDYWGSDDLEPLPMPLQSFLMADVVQGALDAAETGRSDLVITPAGQIVGMLREMKSAKELFEDLVDNSIEILERLLPT